MSDHVAVMNAGRFEQIDTPQNLYSRPETPFVARFVGENNAWSGQVVQRDNEQITIETDEGQQFRVRSKKGLSQGVHIDLFLRPEAILIQADPELSTLNRFEVVVKAILFDGANSRLLVTPLQSNRELLIALPQNRQYDHIRVADKIEVGWDFKSGICFQK
jgi:spermidine/putrescine transport system ATP-binding protein